MFPPGYFSPEARGIEVRPVAVIAASLPSGARVARNDGNISTEPGVAQCSRNSPSIARNSAGPISLACATVTECSSPSNSRVQKSRNFVNSGKCGCRSSCCQIKVCRMPGWSGSRYRILAVVRPNPSSCRRKSGLTMRFLQRLSKAIVSSTTRHCNGGSANVVPSQCVSSRC